MRSNVESGNNQTTSSNVISIKKKPSVRIGAILKEARNKAGLSQKDLADMMEVSRNTVINWEADKNKPDYDTLPELCAMLGISITDLFGVQKNTSLSPLEERLIRNFRLLTPISRSSLSWKDRRKVRFAPEAFFTATEPIMPITRTVRLNFPGAITAPHTLCSDSWRWRSPKTASILKRPVLNRF